jgi:uncharacterized protein VirK/YbjX
MCAPEDGDRPELPDGFTEESNVVQFIFTNKEQSIMLKVFTIVFNEELAKSDSVLTSLRAFLRLLAASRIIFFSDVVLKYKQLCVLEKLFNPIRMWDPLYFAVHKFYLCRSFSFRERLQCAMYHHEYDQHNYKLEYFDQIYSSDGIRLWERVVGEAHFTLALTATDFNRHEGELSVVLSANNTRLCLMSFCYLDANIFGLRSHSTMLISRNQTDITPVRDMFDRCFKKTTPQFFCLFAVCGIAMSNGFRNVLAIRHDSQVAYDKKYESGFRNSYTELWERFGGVDVDGRTYLLHVPLKLSPISLVNPTHRRRARCRRRNWDEIAQSARSTLDGYRVAPAPVRTHPNGRSMSATLAQIAEPQRLAREWEPTK